MSNELITVDSYCHVTKTSLSFKRDVTKDEWQKVFDACNHIEGCIQFWIGDLLKYREQKWGMYDDVAEESGLSKNTLREYKHVAEVVKSDARASDLSFKHHAVIAPLKTEKQKEILKTASDNKWTVKETRQAVKAIKHENLVQPEIPKNKYGVIYADPPWEYQAVQHVDNKITSAASDHYKTMSIDELCLLDIKSLAHDDCVLFIWTTSPLLEKCFPVITAWGFFYRASFVWDKVKHNVGHYNSVRHEFLLIATKGKGTPENVKLFDSVQVIEKTKKHSQKPNEFREIINTLYPSRKKIELFARDKIDGWDVWGNEC